MSRRRTILVVDDDRAMLEWLDEALRDEGFAPTLAAGPSEAIAALTERAHELVLSDVEMPGMRGVDLVAAIHARRPDQLVVLMTAFGSVELAMQSVRAGAADFVTKPFAIETLVHTLERVLRERRMKREIVRLRAGIAHQPAGEVVAVSAAMRRVVDLAARVAQTDASVLVTGESGTGKGVLARFVHARSRRSRGPFVDLNCAALPASLVEAELFGARRGAYTDAKEDRAGLFVDADGGTLFLDEIGEMALEIQPKLLGVLESGRVRPVGGGKERTVDVRLVAATNRPLEEALRERRFRPDLYHRLNVVRLEIPPLRDRREDIPALVDRLTARHAERLDRSVLGVSEEAMRWLVAQDWPGNVRDLSNALERAIALGDHDTITLEDVRSASPPGGARTLDDALDQRLSLDELERRYVLRVLERAGGNKNEAARVLGIDRRTLYRKLKEMGRDEQDE
jgi:DNA-binding NtrC family response regulator